MDWLFGPATNYTIAQGLFIKGLAIGYLFAFWSLYYQVKGLFGSKGINSIQDILSSLEKKRGRKLYLKVPSIFWISSKDSFLSFSCLFGIVASSLVVIGIWPSILLFCLWGVYLSFVSLGSVFLSFQWDTLLLEMGFIGIVFSIQTPAPMIFIYLLWFLLFRFLFSSGIIKLFSRCPEWRSLRAMDYHYLTQPIPNRLAYYAYQKAKEFGRLSVLVVYGLEMVVPFFIFAPPEIQIWTFFLLVFLQVLILATGNYAFFNLLSIVLCIPLLNNTYLKWFAGIAGEGSPHSSAGIAVVLTIIAGGLIFLNVLQFLGLFMRIGRLQSIFKIIGSYLLVNHYGLFARMTTVRNEIIVEGSWDGKVWKTYEFKWKPGDLYIPPRQVAPFHPRLDWQMWFAALGPFQNNPWFFRFLVRLLEGSPDVQGLLEINPFPVTPPKYVRAVLYEYHFSSLDMNRTTGQWWTRTLKGAYSPTLSLKEK